MRVFAGLTLFLALLSPTQAPAANAAVERAIDGFVRPAYRKLHDATGTLSGALAALCAKPSAVNLETARAAFASASEAWSEVEIVRFGPITEGNRLERLLFWPDRKGIGLKQVQSALAGKDATATDPQALAGKSIAMHGFGALEYVLFGTGSDDLSASADPYRCGYGRAIAGNVAGIASDISAAWDASDGFASIWSNPAADNPIYHTDSEAVTELLDTLIQGLEMLRDVRINGFLGKSSETDKPKQAIFWRSGQTVASLAGNLRGLQTLLAQSRLKDDLPADEQWIVESIDAQFANGLKTLSGLEESVEPLLGDAKSRERLSFARDVTTSLSATIGVRLSAALGLTAGFSSLDGD